MNDAHKPCGTATMTDQQFETRLAHIEEQSACRREAAVSYRDQELARLFLECGWTQEKITVEMIEPRYLPLIAYADGWSPSTAGELVAVSTITDKAYSTRVLKRFRATPGADGVSGLTAA